MNTFEDRVSKIRLLLNDADESVKGTFTVREAIAACTPAADYVLSEGIVLDDSKNFSLTMDGVVFIAQVQSSGDPDLAQRILSYCNGMMRV